MCRVGGVFFGIFLVVGVVQVVIGFILVVFFVVLVILQKVEVDQGKYKFIGMLVLIKFGFFLEKCWEELVNKWGNKCKMLMFVFFVVQFEQESVGFDCDVVEGCCYLFVLVKGIVQFIDSIWVIEGLDVNGDGKWSQFDFEDVILFVVIFDCKLVKGLKDIFGFIWKNMLVGYNLGGFWVQQYNGVLLCFFVWCEIYKYVKMIEQKIRKYEQ